MSSEVHLLDRLATPPEGMDFAGGFWTTHDLDGFLLTDSVAPRLSGQMEGFGGTKARRAARTAKVGPLLVLAPCLPTNTVGPLMPPWVHRPSIGDGAGRLHAKFGVLTFANEQQRIWRAFVTSANLTRGGMLRNWELTAVEETAEEQGQALAHELVTAFGDLLGTLRAEEGAAIARSLGTAQPTMDILRTALSLPQGTRLNRVVHTFGSMRPKDLLAQTFSGFNTANARSKNCEIISPPFGSEHSKDAALALAKYLATSARVEITTAFAFQGENRRLAFSGAAHEALNGKGRTIAFWGVPSGPQEPRRTLHAKSVMLSNGKQTRMLMGSANFTARGLGLLPVGQRNRELGIWWDFDSIEEYFEQVSHLDFDAHDGEIDPAPTIQADPIDVGPAISALFRCEAGTQAYAATYAGRLQLDWGDGETPSAVYYGEEQILPTHAERLRLDGVPLVLRESLQVLRCMVNGTAWQVPIEVRPDDPDTFWASEDVVPTDPFLRLLAQARKNPTGPSRSAKPANPGPAGAGTRDDDRFTVKLHQPLRSVVTHLSAVGDLDSSEVETFLEALRTSPGSTGEALDDDAIEVARALIYAASLRRAAAPQGLAGKAGPPSRLPSPLDDLLPKDPLLLALARSIGGER